MTENPLVSALKHEVPDDPNLSAYEKGENVEVLKSWQARKIFQHETLSDVTFESWQDEIVKLIGDILLEGGRGEAKAFNQLTFSLISMACLDTFLQANVTGPPLTWKPTEVLLPQHLQQGPQDLLHASLTNSLSVDGEAVYRRIPHVALFWLAKNLANHHSVVSDTVASRWIRLRVNCWHQRLLNEPAQSLQATINEDISFLAAFFYSNESIYSDETRAQFLIERASIDMLHGDDKKARDYLSEAAELTGFKYVLTGKLGRRTKHQTFDTSQLVLLAKSGEANGTGKRPEKKSTLSESRLPEVVNLNDDTLLDKISFKPTDPDENTEEYGEIPEGLSDLDPESQPLLSPLDSINLLSIASSITNTSPNSGITREETLPFALRVLEGGSSNWQIYSQALLVKSRIETYRSRTVERGVLQMQTLVDQVIAETTDGNKLDQNGSSDGETSAATFLPRPKPSESAPATERLQYIHALACPTRWAIEAELAEKWVSIGGLRTALEIFERLEMWAEAALCWASLDDETKARAIIHKQLYEDSNRDKERVPLPNDAPRLFCILGDFDNDLSLYERSWEVSKCRYARAQRSLGKAYFKVHDLDEADKAYSLSLTINTQSSQAWFALGCIRLELKRWRTAVEAFTQVVQREQDDAEAWSNLAAALMRVPPEEETTIQDASDTSDLASVSKVDPQKHIKQAFVAFKKAAGLKRDSSRIWHNVLNVAATLSPPPYSDIIIAQTRLIELTSSAEGESCVDVEVLEGLLNHIIQNSRDDKSRSSNDDSNGDNSEAPRKKFGLEHMFVELINKKVLPLITHSRRLWLLIARLNIYLNKPSGALDAYEKAWRVTLNRPGWDNESGLSGSSQAASKTNGAHEDDSDPEKVWRSVIESTIELVDAYESLGEKEVTEGLKAGSGELVCKSWKQKARMAIRSVTGRRAKAGLEGMDELQERMEQLKSA